MNKLRVAVVMLLSEPVQGNYILDAMRAVANRYIEEVSVLDKGEDRETTRLVLPGQNSMSPDEDLVVGGICPTDSYSAESIDSTAEYNELVIVFHPHEGMKHAFGDWDNDRRILENLRKFRAALHQEINK